MKVLDYSRVLVITGSGISADSGIPTFRGEDGYWRKHDPVKLQRGLRLNMIQRWCGSGIEKGDK